MLEQLKDATLVELLMYMFIVGTGIGFFNRIPAWAAAWFKKAYRAIRKAEFKELAAEVPHGCQSELECSQRLSSAVTQAVQDAFLPMSGQIEEVDRKLIDGFNDVDTKMGALDGKIGNGLSRVHQRIDLHLNGLPDKTAGKVS